MCVLCSMYPTCVFVCAYIWYLDSFFLVALKSQNDSVQFGFLIEFVMFSSLFFGTKYVCVCIYGYIYGT